MCAQEWQRTLIGLLSLSFFGLAAVILPGARSALAQTRYEAIELGAPRGFGGAIQTVDRDQAAGFSVQVVTIGSQSRYCRRGVSWPTMSVEPVEITPFGSACSDVTAVSRGRLAGTAYGGGRDHPRAFVWSAPSGGTQDLSRPDYENTWAYGISGEQVVGQAAGRATNGYLHAILWTLSNQSISDLNRSGNKESGALGTDGNRQVGWATDRNGEEPHAMLWFGSKDTQIDLNPPRFSGSYGFAVDGSSQVGVGITLSSIHALLWRGSASSAVDLNPKGYVESFGTAVREGIQVGYALDAKLHYHALAWFGDASKYVDLQKVLPHALSDS